MDLFCRNSGCLWCIRQYKRVVRKLKKVSNTFFKIKISRFFCDVNLSYNLRTPYEFKVICLFLSEFLYDNIANLKNNAFHRASIILFFILIGIRHFQENYSEYQGNNLIIINFRKFFIKSTNLTNYVKIGSSIWSRARNVISGCDSSISMT